MKSDLFKYVFFEPHVGAKYGKSGSIFRRKILILGDSHYCDFDCPARHACGDRSIHPSCTDFTNDTMDEYLDPKIHRPWKKTYTTFINSLIGRKTTHSDRIAVMESVVFYNFLQVAAGEDAVSAKAFDAKYSDVSNMKAFKEVLDHTGPDVVVSWGYRLWETLPNDWGFGEAEKGVGIPIEGKNFYCYYTYPFNGKPILLIGAHHPSVGYDSKFHSDIFAALDVG